MEDTLLRIDETSGTLVAPQAGGLVTENSPERDELLALIGASWPAFAQELGLPNLRLVATEPAPGVDLLAFDEQSGRAVVLHVTGETVEWQISRALAAAAEVAGWDAARLASVSDALEAVVPGDSPQLVLVAGGYDPRALATVEWLSSRHGVEASCFSVSVLRFGNERLLSVHREPRDGQATDAAAQVQWMLTGAQPRRAPDAAEAPAALAAASTPPPEQLEKSVPPPGPVHPSHGPRVGDGRLVDLQPRDLRVVVGLLVGELGVDVHRVVLRERQQQRRRHEDVVERLRVALEHVRVALVRRQQVVQVQQLEALEDLHRLGELEVVDVPEHDVVRRARRRAGCRARTR